MIKIRNIKTSKNLDQRYLEKIKDIDFHPVFILGLPRSGTSILYKILAETKCFNSVKAYHVIKYDQLLYDHIHKLKNTSKEDINQYFKEKGLVDRGMDRLQITADFPEEYGYILGQRTRQMYIVPENLPVFIEMTKKIQFISENNKPLLLKNPFDFSNIAYIKKVLPNSKFIFIFRDPIDILSSTVKAISFLLTDKHPYSAQIFRAYNKIFENPLLLYIARFCFSKLPFLGLIYITLHSAKVSEHFLKNVKYLSSEDYINVTYEELCKNPQDTVEKIMSFVNVELKDEIDFKSLIKPRKTSIEPSVLKMKNFICKSMNNYVEYFKPELEKE